MAKIKVTLIIICSVVALSRCVTASNVVPFGPDTFMISTSGESGFHTDAGAKMEAVQIANKHCQSLGKEMVPVNIESRNGVPGRAFPSAELIFRCLDKDDPEFKRPTMTKQPDVVIHAQ